MKSIGGGASITCNYPQKAYHCVYRLNGTVQGTQDYCALDLGDASSAARNNTTTSYLYDETTCELA